MRCLLPLWCSYSAPRSAKKKRVFTSLTQLMQQQAAQQQEQQAGQQVGSQAEALRPKLEEQAAGTA